MFKDKKYDPNAAWRHEAASAPQLELLARLSIEVPANATKGQASDLISRAIPPDDEQIEFLQFSDVRLPNSATELDAKRLIRDIIANPVNKAKWDANPATSQQLEVVAYVDGKAPQDLSLMAADRLIRSYARDDTKTSRYNEISAILDERREAEFERQNRLSFLYDHCQTLNRGHTEFGLKRVGVKVVGDAVAAWQRETGKSIHELECATFFIEELAERIRLIDPEVATDEARQHPERFALWRETASHQGAVTEVANTRWSVTGLSVFGVVLLLVFLLSFTQLFR